MDTKVRYSQKGDLSISGESISTIVSLAAQEVEGVSAIKHDIAGQISSFFKKNSYYHGVRVDSNEEGLVLDVNLKVFYGSQISDVALNVQENIKLALENMLDIKVNEVHVHVVGIDFNVE